MQTVTQFLPSVDNSQAKQKKGLRASFEFYMFLSCLCDINLSMDDKFI